MSLPVFKHIFRSKRIEWNLFPNNRKRLFDRSYRIFENLNVISVFVFWIFLIFAAEVGFSTFLGLRVTKSYSLPVQLPKAKFAKWVDQDKDGIFIFLGLNTMLVVNDQSIRSSKHLRAVLLELFNLNERAEIYLFCDKQVKMDWVTVIVREIEKAGFEHVYFMIRGY